MAAPRLYYMPRTRSSRVLWLLEEIGAPYELTEISGAQRRSDEHLQRHPLGRVPALELAGGTTMFESAAICLQLADLNPSAGLIGPVGSAERALAYQWVLFAVSELEAPLFRWIRELGEGVTESPAHDRFAEAAAALQSALTGRDWLIDDRLSVADVMCASVLQGANARELLRPWPELEAYVQHGEARPAHARAAAISGRPSPTCASERGVVAGLCRSRRLGAEARSISPRGYPRECVVSVRKVNIVSVELDERLDVAGFRHVETSLRARLGAQAIGAAIYEAYAGQPIWPYGYHHGVEEWLYVISGAPVLREPAGERALTPGEFVCFPSGHRGAHALAGPGRFVIFSTGDHLEPWLSVYPDSDKVSGPDGILLRSSAVGYWHGEGTGAAADDPIILRREPASAARRPVVNARSIPVEDPRPDAAPGSRARTVILGPLLQAERLGASVVELDPGEGSEPYHYEYGREEWLLVLAGAPTLRHPAGTELLAAGETVCFPDGPAGAHRLINHSEHVARIVLISTLGLPANVRYPDTGEWLLRNRADAQAVMLHDRRAERSA